MEMIVQDVNATNTRLLFLTNLCEYRIIAKRFSLPYWRDKSHEFLLRTTLHGHARKVATYPILKWRVLALQNGTRMRALGFIKFLLAVLHPRHLQSLATRTIISIFIRLSAKKRFVPGISTISFYAEHFNALICTLWRNAINFIFFFHFIDKWRFVHSKKKMFKMYIFIAVSMSAFLHTCSQLSQIYLYW